MTNQVTTPMTQNGGAQGVIQNDTQPQDFQTASIDIAAVQSGVATNYWLELKAYPTGTARSLWLKVNNSWKRLDNPNAVSSDCVQRAFLGSGSNVRVWYNGQVVVGLVVEGN